MVFCDHSLLDKFKDDDFPELQAPLAPQGTVNVFFDRTEPASYKELTIQTKLGPILRSIADDYSPIESKHLGIDISVFTDIFLQEAIHKSTFRLPKGGQ